MKNCFLPIILCFLFLGSGSLRADSNVKSVQQTLSALGYYQGAITGKLDSKTSTAISHFQSDNHLQVTGALTKETITALGVNPSRSASPIHLTHSAPPLQTSYSVDPRALADLFVGGPLLAASPEVQVATIRKVQDDLRVLGYYHGPINGGPDFTLTQCLKAYQHDSRFKMTGRLDKITLQGLDIDPDPYTPGR